MGEGWPLVRLGDVLALQRRWLRPDAERQYVEIGVRSFGRGIFHKAPVSGATLGDKRVLRIAPGDLVFMNVFAWEGAVAVAGPSETETIGSHRYATYQPAEDRCSAQFLNLFFKTALGLELLRKVSPGSAGRNRTMNLAQFAEQPIPLPPIEEQRRIVARVEAIAAKVEEAQRLRRAAEVEADGLVGAAVRSQLAGVETKVALADAVDAERPITYGIVQAGPHVPDGVPYVRVSDMASPELSSVGMLRTSSDIAARYARSSVRAGDIVFAIRATVGKMRFVPPELAGANLTQGTARIAPSERARAEYLYWALRSPEVVEEIASATKGTTFREITLGRLRAISIPLPPVPQQTRIVARLDEFAELKSQLGHGYRRVEAELSAVLPSVLDRAFRGEL